MTAALAEKPSDTISLTTKSVFNPHYGDIDVSGEIRKDGSVKINYTVGSQTTNMTLTRNGRNRLLLTEFVRNYPNRDPEIALTTYELTVKGGKLLAVDFRVDNGPKNYVEADTICGNDKTERVVYFTTENSSAATMASKLIQENKKDLTRSRADLVKQRQLDTALIELANGMCATGIHFGGAKAK